MSRHETKPTRVSRRRVLQSAASAAAFAAATPATAKASRPALSAEPFPLEAVRLLPSLYLTALEANRTYLHKLDPDRLLHNYRVHAGLAPKGEIYGGWESESIAGHTLGHYLSACALMHAQTGDAECKRRTGYIVDELAECQAQSSDGFVGAFLRRRGDVMENGNLAFEDVRRGEIRATNFDLNGAWSPLYNWHKLLAGLLHADRYCGVKRAIAVAERLGGYIEGIFAALDDAQVQKVLLCEYGGINEAFAELYARTGRRRWLALAERIYDRKVLDPLAEGRDELAHLHANTQVPKLVGLARLHELTGKPRYAKASAFFWNTVTTHYTYVIGGNSDREYFQKPSSISKFITEQTCESCNSYNMLKLTRRLYARRPDASYFDFYERTHLNHIMAQQNPRTGMFAYMNPLMSGRHREFSSPDSDFWCCVGTGMESHAKHGESIYWRAGGELRVNLYIPSTLDWAAEGTRVELTTPYPFGDDVHLKVLERKRRVPLTIALRVPAWCTTPQLTLNGTPVNEPHDDGYVRIRHAFKAGDALTLSLPSALRIEATPDDAGTVALLHGPLVLAADLGPASETWDGPAPVLVAQDVLAGISAVEGEPAAFRTNGIGRPGDLTLKPFAFQHERNTAVYFRRFTDAEWQIALAQAEADEARLKELDARSADVMRLGEDAAEKDHDLAFKISYPVAYRGRHGRDARSDGYFEFTMKTRPGPLTLQATYWGGERNRRFAILVDGTVIGTERLEGEHDGEFIAKDYPIPPALTKDKASIRVRFEPEQSFTAGPSFGVRLYSPHTTTPA